MRDTVAIDIIRTLSRIPLFLIRTANKISAAAQSSETDLVSSRDALPGEHFINRQQDPGNPLNTDPDLRDRLLSGASSQDFPYLFQDEQEILWFSMPSSDGFVAGGPVSLKKLDTIAQHRFYRSYGIPQKLEQPIASCSVQELLAVIQALYSLLTGQEVSNDRLIFENGLARRDFDEMERLQIEKEIRELDRGDYHHTWQEERELAGFIAAGDVEKAYECHRQIMDRVGEVSQNTALQAYNLAVVSITLNTRAAIQGGLPPQEAYALSDFYIQQLHVRDSALQLDNVTNNCLIDLTRRVHDHAHRGSSYVEKCKVYVGSHYKDKLYLGDIAEALGISEGYLSRIFAQETGETFQSWLLKFRLERAANLLKYSDRPIAEICAYVGIASPSYFGEQFRRFYHETPRKYRSAHKTIEFT